MTTTTIDPKVLLDQPFRSGEWSNDNADVTLREYFKRMLVQVFAEGEGFSGKRPFGDSGWQSQLEFDMVKAGLLPPDPQNNADFGEMFADVPSFEALIRECIKAL